MGGVILGSAMECVIHSQKEIRNNFQKGEAEMTGAFVGSSAELIVKEASRWGAVCINTGCNLACSHCYLGEKKGNEAMSSEIAEKIAGMPWSGIVIVGTEPFLDEDSVKIAEIFAKRPGTRALTNGVNLGKFARRVASLEAVDISLDGGPKTYSRGPDFSSIVESSGIWRNVSGKDVFALHTLTVQNLGNIGDMLEGSRLIGSASTYFSPMIPTLGGCNLPPVSVEQIVQALKSFAGGNWKLVVDPIHAFASQETWDKIKDLMTGLPEENRLIADFDPGERVVRINHMGRAFHPFFSLHPGIKLPGVPLA